MRTAARLLHTENTRLSVREAIRARRAIRHYLSQPVTEGQVKELIDAAIHAPSAMNSQPWAFVVIQNPAVLKRISDDANESTDIFYGTTTLIVICGNEEAGFSSEGDCNLAAQNLMLAAQEMHLATCPIGMARDVLREQKWKDELSIPAGYTAVLPIIVGYADGSMPETERAAPKIFSWNRSTAKKEDPSEMEDDDSCCVHLS